VLFSGLAGLINSALQLVVLVAFAGVPLWLYLVVSFIVLGIVVPLVATPALLLYGDAVAASQGRDPADTDVSVLGPTPTAMNVSSARGRGPAYK